MVWSGLLLFAYKIIGYFRICQCVGKVKCPGGQMVSSPYFRLWDPWLQSHWRQNKAHDYGASLHKAFHYHSSYTSIWHNVEKALEHQIIIMWNTPCKNVSSGLCGKRRLRSQMIRAFTVRQQNYLILQNVWMESKRPRQYFADVQVNLNHCILCFNEGHFFAWHDPCVGKAHITLCSLASSSGMIRCQILW